MTEPSNSRHGNEIHAHEQRSWLAKHHKWVFDHNSDDIRGWPVLDDAGNRVGTVMELVVDTGSAYVTEIVLSDGQRMLARDLELGDRQLRVTRPRPAAVVTRPKPAEPIAAPKLEVVPPPARLEPVAAPSPTPMVADDLVVQLIDEELDVGKRRYDTGGVHLETRVIAEPFAETVRLHEERVSVQRNKVDRELDAAEAAQLCHDSTFELRAKTEVPLVCKSAHVIEEIVIKKNALDRIETVRDTVRHMDAEVIELNGDGKGGKS